MKLLLSTYSLDLPKSSESPESEIEVLNDIKTHIIERISADNLIHYSKYIDDEGVEHIKGELQFYRIEKENPEG